MSRKPLQFTVYGRPKPKSRPRFDRRTGRVLTPEATIRAQEEFAEKAGAICLAHFLGPLEGPVELELVFCYLPPKWSGNEEKRQRAIRGEIHYAHRPDLDNLIKLAKDALTDADVWKDDDQVVTLIARKRYAAFEGTVVWLREVD